MTFRLVAEGPIPVTAVGWLVGETWNGTLAIAGGANASNGRRHHHAAICFEASHSCTYPISNGQ